MVGFSSATRFLLLGSVLVIDSLPVVHLLFAMNLKAMHRREESGKDVAFPASYVLCEDLLIVEAQGNSFERRCQSSIVKMNRSNIITSFRNYCCPICHSQLDI